MKLRIILFIGIVAVQSATPSMALWGCQIRR